MKYFLHGFEWHLGRMFAHMVFAGGIALILFVVMLVLMRGKR